MKLLTVIFGTGVYFYAVPILLQYGYNSYFGIPGNFIEPSIRGNFIFFFSLFQLAQSIVGTFSFWTWIMLGILVPVIWFLVAFRILSGVIISGVLILLTGLSLFGFHNFGQALAKSATEFQTLPVGCLLEQEKNVTYIIPAYYQTTALIVPIYTDTHKLTGGFLPRESSSLNCEIKKQPIGQITQ